MKTPTYEELFNPLLSAMHALGGSGHVNEVESKVIELMKLPDEAVSAPHNKSITKLSYRLAWARTYLKRYGLLENSSKGVWALTPQGRETTHVDPEKVHRINREVKLGRQQGPSSEDLNWKSELLNEVRAMDPKAFEFLCQRLLREAGFEKVEVTGRSGDGGIDGKGIMKIGGMLSFHVVFQCKRYAGSVPSKEIRDFRGAMSGRSDKGLFITTGRFTPDASGEAQRDGAVPIDLIDGDQLSDLMLELGIGVSKESKEVVDLKWFEGFKKGLDDGDSI